MTSKKRRIRDSSEPRWSIESAEFIASAPEVAKLPHAKHPEIAIVGRSNVGKSTFINRFAAKRGLARVSSMPGKTQHAVMFEIVAACEGDARLALTLVDLPGYGYARVSAGKKKEMGILLKEYLRTREGIRALCLLNDCRRLPEQEEVAVYDLAREREIPVILVLTKWDKLKRSEHREVMSGIARAYGLEPQDALVSGEAVSIDPVWDRLRLLAI